MIRFSCGGLLEHPQTWRRLSRYVEYFVVVVIVVVVLSDSLTGARILVL